MQHYSTAILFLLYLWFGNFWSAAKSPPLDVAPRVLTVCLWASSLKQKSTIQTPLRDSVLSGSLLSSVLLCVLHVFHHFLWAVYFPKLSSAACLMLVPAIWIQIHLIYMYWLQNKQNHFTLWQDGNPDFICTTLLLTCSNQPFICMVKNS